MNKLIATVLLGLTSVSANAFGLNIGSGDYDGYCSLMAEQASIAYSNRLKGYTIEDQYKEDTETVNSFELDNYSLILSGLAVEDGTTIAYNSEFDSGDIESKVYDTCMTAIAKNNGKVR